jgi:hypothetical protein
MPGSNRAVCSLPWSNPSQPRPPPPPPVLRACWPRWPRPRKTPPLPAKSLRLRGGNPEFPAAYPLCWSGKQKLPSIGLRRRSRSPHPPGTMTILPTTSRLSAMSARCAPTLAIARPEPPRPNPAICCLPSTLSPPSRSRSGLRRVFPITHPKLLSRRILSPQSRNRNPPAFQARAWNGI